MSFSNRFEFAGSHSIVGITKLQSRIPGGQGSVTLKDARDAIHTNWIKAFKQFVIDEDLTRDMEPVD
jgi:hypothetical protein